VINLVSLTSDLLQITADGRLSHCAFAGRIQVIQHVVVVWHGPTRWSKKWHTFCTPYNFIKYWL